MIHFDDPQQCDMSMKFLFEVCKETNIYVSFGAIEEYFDDFESAEYNNHIKKSRRQFEMEKYFCKQDFVVYDKYQKMKKEFSKWLNKDSPQWFNCINMNTLTYLGINR